MYSRKRVKGVSLPNIPEDVVIGKIISRLPAKDICRYRCVCKACNETTTTLGFKESHLRHARPNLLVLKMNNRYKSCPLLHTKWWDLDHPRPTIHRLTNYPIDGLDSVNEGFSHDGLIILKDRVSNRLPRDFTIFNPIYSQVVRVRLPPKFMHHSDICGAFFHPILKEYCTLLKIVTRDDNNSSGSTTVKYKLLNLGLEPRWKEINNPWSHNKSMVHGTCPLYVNGAIYWVVNGDDQHHLRSIMVYMIITEKFELIPCSSELSMARSTSLNIQLVNIDGLPSLVQIQEIRPSFLHICIWTLKNNGEPFWTLSTYYAAGDGKELMPYSLKAIVGVDEILAFHNGKRIFLCNLRRGNIIRYAREKYNTNVEFWSHVPSLVSLNCRPLIRMEEDEQI